jgi:hypothetical protein
MLHARLPFRDFETIWGENEETHCSYYSVTYWEYVSICTQFIAPTERTVSIIYLKGVYN